MVCAIVTAAGRSRRMGTQKLLLPFGGGTVIGRVVGQLSKSRVARVFVVHAEGDRSITDALAGFDVTLIPNPDPDGEMLGSIRCGLRALPPSCTGVLVALGDQPGFSPELVNQIVDAFDPADPAILVPVHGGRRGHPLLFHSSFIEAILTRFDGEGLRGLFRAHPDRVREVSVPADLLPNDIDDPEDYRRELARLAGGGK
jgi:molybdenum cofactor cytidylyltransferase